MYFERIYEKGLAQASFLIGCQMTGEAIVIDPKRDVDTYIALADQNKLKITKVAETHIHADFLSGSRELCALTGAELLLSDEGGADWQYEFPHTGLKHGDIIHVGNLELSVLHTPGHTPESISFLLVDKPATTEPVIVLSGDFVFVGDVGRPDLLEKAAGVQGTMEVGAEEMYESLQAFKALGDFIQVWPGHGAGSSCGKSLGAVASSTIGYEKIRNWALNASDKGMFKEQLLDGQPDPPTYFAEMKRLNKVDRPLLLNVPQPARLSSTEFFEYAKDANVQVVDTRNKLAFAAAHYPSTLNIQLNNTFSTWCGWMLSYEQPIVLIVEEKDVEQAVRKLMRIGLDNVVGVISFDEIEAESSAVTSVISIDEMQAISDDPADYIILDVRNRSEFTAGHIAHAAHYFVGHLRQQIASFPDNRPLVVYCQSGDRAAIASSFLQQHGFTDLRVYFGGMAEWKAQQRSLVIPS